MNKLPTLVCLGVLTLLSFGVQAQIVNPALSASLERDVTLPQRDVRRLLNEAQRSDLIEQEREIRRQAKEAAERALSASESQGSRKKGERRLSPVKIIIFGNSEIVFCN